jgi:hypothetical protein
MEGVENNGYPFLDGFTPSLVRLGEPDKRKSLPKIFRWFHHSLMKQWISVQKKGDMGQCICFLREKLTFSNGFFFKV